MKEKPSEVNVRKNIKLEIKMEAASRGITVVALMDEVWECFKKQKIVNQKEVK